MNVAPLPAKDIIWSDRHAQVQIAWFAAIGAGLSFTGYANSGAILNPGGDTHFDGVRLQRRAMSLTGRTGSATKGSASVAGGTGHGLL